MEGYKNNEELEIDLGEIFHLLLNKIWIILSVTVGVAILAFIISKVTITPMYQSETKIFILSKQTESNLTYSDLQMGSQLTKDYKEIITCRAVVEDVISHTGSNLTYGQLVSKISVDVPADTRIITISVDDEDPVEAMNICNAVREASSKHIKNVMNIEAVNVVEEANLPEQPYKPSNKKNAMIGGLLGAFLTIFIIILRFILDDTIKTPDDIEKKLGLSTLGSIPLMEVGSTKNGKSKKKNAKKRG